MNIEEYIQELLNVIAEQKAEIKRLNKTIEYISSANIKKKTNGTTEVPTKTALCMIQKLNAQQQNEN